MTLFSSSTRIIYPAGELGTILGWNAAQVVHQPLLTQSAFAQSDAAPSLIERPGSLDAFALVGPDGRPVRADAVSETEDVPAHVRSMRDAFDALVEGQVRAAGRSFEHARESLDEKGDEGRCDPLYATAAFGEALWAHVNAATFDALESVKTNFPAVARPGSMVKALAYFRTGHDAPAIELLEQLSGKGAPKDAITVNALMALADLRMSRGVRRTHHEREEEYRVARKILTKRVPEFFEAWGATLDAMPEGREKDEALAAFASHRKVAAEILFHMASVFRESEYHVFARDVIETIVTRFACTEAAIRILAGDKIAQPYIEGSSIKKHASLGDRVVAGAFAMAGNAALPTRGEYWQLAAAGGLVGAALATAIGGGIDYPTAMQALGVGATTAVALRKIVVGTTAPETRQSYATGYTDRTLGNAILKSSGEVFKLMVTYALFGGALPGVGLLKQVPGLRHLVAHASGQSGQLVGVGSAMGWLFESTVDWGQRLQSVVAARGWDEGIQTFWEVYRKNTVFGSSLQNVGKFWSHAVTWENLRSVANTSATSSGLAAVLLKLYEGLAATYAMAMMARPSWRELLQRRFTRELPWVEAFLMPGAYVMAADINLALGVKPGDAWTIPMLGIVVQLRQHVMGGGRSDNIDYSKVMTGMLIPTLYAGTGQQMEADKIIYDKGSIADLFANSMGVQVGLLPIGIVHALCAGLDVKKLLEGKAAKCWREESIGNAGRSAIGWGTFWGTAYSMIVQQIFLQPWISSRYREITGTANQRGQFLKNLLTLKPQAHAASNGNTASHDAEALARYRQRFVALIREADALADQYADRPRQISLRKMVRGMSAAEKLGLVNRLYFVRGHVPFPTTPSRGNYRKIVYRSLMAPELTEAQLEGYLEDLSVMLRDVDFQRRGFRHNMVIATYAASDGPRGERIRAFFEQNAWVTEQYPLQQKTIKRKVTSGMSSRKQLRLVSKLYFGRGHAPFAASPSTGNFRKIAYRSLMDAALTEAQLAAYLGKLAVLLQDSDAPWRGFRHGLAISTWAASGGPHGAQIRAFFEEHPWVAKQYPLPQLAVKEVPAKGAVALAESGAPGAKRKTGAKEEIVAIKKTVPPPRRMAGMWFLQNVQAAGYEKFEESVATAGTLWPFWNFITGKTVAQAATYGTSLTFTFLKKDAPFPTMPNETFYRKVVFRFLTSKSSKENEVENYLLLLDEMARADEPKRRHVHQNLVLCAWAARKNPYHGKRFQKFFDDHPMLREKYSLVDEPPPRSWTIFSGARSWFRARLVGTEDSADGMIVPE